MKEYLRRLIADAVMALDFPSTEFLIERPAQKEHGNYSSNVALTLTRELRRNPLEIANEIKDALQDTTSDIQEIRVAPPGFINFYLSKDYFRKQITEIHSKGDQFGQLALDKRQTAIVEFVSANPTGPLTIGHGRQAVLGDTISNILTWNGYDVTREYYYNNAGRQMRVLAESVKSRYYELLKKEYPFPEDGYQGEYIRDIAQSLIDDHGESLIDTENLDPFLDRAEKMVFDDINGTLERLGVIFDHYYNERSLYEDGTIDQVLNTFKKKNYSYEAEGATWFKAEEFGLEQNRVIVKSTGEPTYRLPDIAYHTKKIERGFNRIIDIFGADHHAAYPDVIAGLKALGYSTENIEVLLHQFVTLYREGKKMKMSTRKANYVTLDELMDEVGVNVVRYFFLMRTMNSHLNFDLDLALQQSDENPVFYLQYAHARICNIFKKGEEREIEFSEQQPELSLLGEESEIELMEKMTDFPEIIEKCGNTLEPLHLCTYLQELASVLHKFYTDHLVLDKSNLLMTQARLYLIDAARIVLANGLSILGVDAPQRM